MTDEEFLLFDRIQKIQQVTNQYGIDNFYISYSGGKDSVVLSKLFDLAIPGNRIPRVYCDTGIEFCMMLDFVKSRQDNRIEIIKPKVPIKPMLETCGYPFKSKEHSEYLGIYQRNGMSKTPKRYLYPSENRKRYGCPKILRYQFSENFDIKISDKCCEMLKERPLREWSKEHDKPIAVIGVRHEEGGRRNRAKCLAFISGKLRKFQPIAVVSSAWEDWFIDRYDLDLCDIYKPPYNFERTGCKGCPFNLDLQAELDILAEYFPQERKQCEAIWGPVYSEYRRLGYRLRKEVRQSESRKANQATAIVRPINRKVSDGTV